MNCTTSRTAFAKMTVTKGAVLKRQIESETTWHNRLGHAHIESIRSLERTGSVIGLHIYRTKGVHVPCESCIASKFARKFSRLNPIRVKHVGGCIHTDVCGPMSIPSLGGSRYFVTFIDEYSNFVNVRFIEKKSEVASEFRSFKAWFERKFDCAIKRLHTDGGGEYIALKGYLKDQGIEWTYSPPYSSNQNGISERANRTLVETALSMLTHAGLPKVFWAEAVEQAADIRNRFLAPRVGSKTSYELCTALSHVWITTKCLDQLLMYLCQRRTERNSMQSPRRGFCFFHLTTLAQKSGFSLDR